MSEPIRTLIADDEPLARRQLRSLLERDPQIRLVGEAGSGTEARRRVQELKPELLLLDVRMPQGDGFSVLEDLDQYSLRDLRHGACRTCRTRLRRRRRRLSAEAIR